MRLRLPFRRHIEHKKTEAQADLHEATAAVLKAEEAKARAQENLGAAKEEAGLLRWQQEQNGFADLFKSALSKGD
jgi:hypothetical protein